MFVIKNIIVFLALVVTSCLAEPTQKETINFIQNRTNLYSTDNKTGKHVVHDRISISGCTITQHQDYYMGQDFPRDRVRFVADLKDFDPTLVQYDSTFDLQLYNREHLNIVDTYLKTTHNATRKKHITQLGYKYDKKTNTLSKKNDSYSMLIHVSYPSAINGPKLVKAFKHLIKLCRGKDELF